MIVSDKKMNLMVGIKRTNLSKVGYVGGAITGLRAGDKELCIEKDNVIMYLVNDFDTTIEPSDIVEWCIDDVGLFRRQKPGGDSSTRANEYVTHIKCKFSI